MLPITYINGVSDFPIMSACPSILDASRFASPFIIGRNTVLLVTHVLSVSSSSTKSQVDFTALIMLPLGSGLIPAIRLFPKSCRSCCATYEKIFDIVGNGSMSKTCDQTLLYCSFKPRRNRIARSLSFLCAMIVKAEHVHRRVQEQVGSGLKFSNSSHTMCNLVKYSVMERSPCFIKAASC